MGRKVKGCSRAPLQRISVLQDISLNFIIKLTIIYIVVILFSIKENTMNENKITIEIPIDLYARFGTLAINFETPAQVIEKLLNAYQGKGYTSSTKGATFAGKVTSCAIFFFLVQDVNLHYSIKLIIIYIVICIMKKVTILFSTKDNIMNENKITIEISSDLYARLGTLAISFETPAQVIEKLLNAYQDKGNLPEPNNEITISNNPTPRIGDSNRDLPELEIIYFSDNDKDGEEGFKEDFLDKGKAYIKLFYLNGKDEIKIWNKIRFNDNSFVKGNLMTGRLRHWKKDGICKAVLSTNITDIHSYSN